MEYPRLKSAPRHASNPTSSPTPVTDTPPDTEPVRFTPSTRHHGPKKEKTSPKKRLVMFALLAVLGLVLGWFALQATRGTAATYIDSSQYQAVFFTNGQVYFGKLGYVGDNYLKLSDVFYIQANQPNAGNPQETQGAKDNNDMQLIKLGNEIHGPHDTMIINRDQVLFFENLKGDGKLVRGIEEYHKTQKN